MNDVNIHQLIRERFSALPEKLQQAITSTEVAEKLRAISNKYRLHLDQGQTLENETYMVLLGIEEAEKYEDNVRRELGIPKEDAHAIATDVAEEIFLSVRGELKERTKETEEPAPQTPPQEPLPEAAPQPKKAEDRFSQVVKRPSQNIEIKPKNGSYTVDPYREPIQ